MIYRRKRRYVSGLKGRKRVGKRKKWYRRVSRGGIRL